MEVLATWTLASSASELQWLGEVGEQLKTQKAFLLENLEKNAMTMSQERQANARAFASDGEGLRQGDRAVARACACKRASLPL